MGIDSSEFFGAVMAAGAILSGFCGTFLSFRIQREASYYRQVALDFEKEEARDVFIGLTHFTLPFALLILATLLSMAFGFILPLLALGGVESVAARPDVVIAGLLGALIFLVGYFASELIHYRIVSSKLLNDASEWGKGRWVLISVVLVAGGTAISVLVWV